jgi:hypothetical protein
MIMIVRSIVTAVTANYAVSWNAIPEGTYRILLFDHEHKDSAVPETPMNFDQISRRRVCRSKMYFSKFRPA